VFKPTVAAEQLNKWNLVLEHEYSHWKSHFKNKAHPIWKYKDRLCLSKVYISKHVSNCTLCTLEICEAYVGLVRDRILFPMAIRSAAFQKLFYIAVFPSVKQG